MDQENKKISDDHVRLAHGNGGRFMREMVDAMFARHLKSGLLDTTLDAVCLPDLDGQVCVTTDGFSVQPLEFPGGNIGSLAVHGTVNDLAVAGAIPRYLTLGAMLEEGVEIALLERVVEAMAAAVAEAGVQIVAGDTKVLPRGHGGGIYFTTTGVGVRDPGLDLSMGHIQPGDRVLVSGPVGDHGAAVMLAREDFGLSGDVPSDSAAVSPLIRPLSGMDGIHFLRDPTRGGLATVMHEIALATGHAVRLYQDRLPVREAVQSICDILGYDPLYLACEGRVVAIVSAESADQVLACWRAMPAGELACAIGTVEAGEPVVLLQTPIGGERVLEELEDDPLPRIC